MRRTRGALKWLLLVATAAAVLAAIPASGSARPSGATAKSFSPSVGSIGGIVPVSTESQPFTCFPPNWCGSGNLQYRGGPVMRTNTTYAIYWTPTGHTLPSGYATTVNQYFTDVAADSGGTNNVYGIDTQYFDGTGNIAYNSTFAGSVVDTNAYPSSGCPIYSGVTVCLTDAQLQAEIKSVVNAQGWPKNGTSLYFLFTPQGVGSCFDSGGTECAFVQYCAYHGNFNVTGGEILYANQPYNALPGCDTNQHPNGNAADATINVVSHEHNEAITDPQPNNAWSDAIFYEIGDKCAWTFGSVSGPGGAEYNQTINGHHYYLQEEYDNASHSCLQRPGSSTPATVTSLKPNAVGQGATKAKVKINGSNFVSGATVSVSGTGVTVKSVTFVSSTVLNAVLAVAGNAATGARDVSVTNPGASAGTCSGCLTIDLGPVVSSVVPSTGVHGTSIPVQILGSNFVNGATVKFNKGISVVSTTFVSSGQINATISISSTAKLGGHPVTVTNPDKGATTKANAITVT